jgi:predicted CXXCH cytochrome family protein
MTLANARQSGLALLTLVFFLSGCGDDIVYRDRDRNSFEEPPANAGGFLGYSDVSTKRTTCGNCHSGKQAMWQQTAHAGAWTTLAANTAKKPECEACHSVSSEGNPTASDNVGYVSTRSSRYQDVQCESCHGPGITHVQNPDISANKPLAALAVSTTLDRGCGECHSGAHQPFAEEWSASRHARPAGTRATNTSCNGCHEAKAVLKAWGIVSTFKEDVANPPEHMGITCGVCHDPHQKRNAGQLRYALDVPALESNLCMKCHYRRSVPEVASSSGPHSPQGPLLLGEAGWTPPNFVYPAGSLVGSHGSDRNPRLCAGCHVNSYTVTDKVTGAFTFRSTGHRFLATPCVDGNGIPTATQTCDPLTKSYKACAQCHSESGARSALAVRRESIERYALQIEGLLTRIPAAEFSTTDNRITTAEGSRFNMQLAREKGSAAHNPFLIEALLLASIRQIELDYGIRPAIITAASHSPTSP